MSRSRGGIRHAFRTRKGGRRGCAVFGSTSAVLFVGGRQAQKRIVVVVIAQQHTVGTANRCCRRGRGRIRIARFLSRFSVLHDSVVVFSIVVVVFCIVVKQPRWSGCNQGKGNTTVGVGSAFATLSKGSDGNCFCSVE